MITRIYNWMKAKIKKLLICVGILGVACASGGAVIDNQINPYQKVGETYVYQIEDRKVELREEGDFVIADLTKWDGEVKISVKRELKDRTKLERKLCSNKLTAKNHKEEIHLYPVDEGFEYEVILLEKPESNVISLELETENLDFFYQPELTQEEIDEGAFRPENITGSYAVYHSTKQGDYTALGGKNYMAGKAYHIYRPRMCDSNNWCIWGEYNEDLNETGILANTLPLDFWENAFYPVKHSVGATFGDETCGASYSGVNGYIKGGLYSPASSGTVTSITSCLGSYVSGEKYKTALYSQSGTTYTLISPQSEEFIASGTGSDWNEFSVDNASINSAITYWIVLWGDGVGPSIKTDTSGGDDRTQSASYGSWPSTINGPTGSSYKRSIFATYTSDEPGGADYNPNLRRVNIIE